MLAAIFVVGCLRTNVVFLFGILTLDVSIWLLSAACEFLDLHNFFFSGLRADFCFGWKDFAMGNGSSNVLALTKAAGAVGFVSVACGEFSFDRLLEESWVC